jgi:hypothetical protein
MLYTCAFSCCPLSNLSGGVVTTLGILWTWELSSSRDEVPCVQWPYA